MTETSIIAEQANLLSRKLLKAAIKSIPKPTRNRIIEWQWHQQFQRMHPKLVNQEPDTQKLRLILGVGRSGTTWLSRVLSETSTPIRFFMEGLYSVKPKLSFSEGNDHTAIKYYPKLPERHSLLSVYRSLIKPQYNWSALGLNRHLQRDDPNWQFCLVKEVHSLLATEALLQFFSCPTVIVVRDPVYVIDSLFARDGLSSPYLCDESKVVRQVAFLKRFMPEQSEAILEALHKVNSIGKLREQSILKKVLTVAIIQQMFCVLADKFQCIYLIEYEELCQSSQALFRSVAEFFTLDWDDRVERFLATTTQTYSNKADKYPVFRQTSCQVKRNFKFLSFEEVNLCHQILSDSKLRSHYLSV